MAKPKKKFGIPILNVPKNATRKQIYAIIRKEFTADDFYRCIEPGPTVPAEQVLADLERIHQEESERLRKKKHSPRQKSSGPIPSRGKPRYNRSVGRSTGFRKGRKMARPKKKDDDLILRVPKNATLKQIYAIARKEFTAEDLQKYTEIDTEPTVPMEEVLAEMERIHKAESEKLRKRRKK